MNNPKSHQNHKIEGVFESEMAADNFIDKMKKIYNGVPPTSNILCTKRQATEDKKTVNGNVKKGNWIVCFEGKKESIDDITMKIAENGGFYL